LPVLVVRLVMVSMARELMGRTDRRQWLGMPKIGRNEVEQGVLVTP
jgi:hypothetical protein